MTIFYNRRDRQRLLRHTKRLWKPVEDNPDNPLKDKSDDTASNNRIVIYTPFRFEC
jgi:hypothetical protein